MAEKRSFDEYDAFARIYNDQWGPDYGPRDIPLLKALLGDMLENSPVILDLCCGSGHVSQALIEHGHEVVGVDGSARLLGYAQTNAPTAEFHHADARNFALASEFHGAICLNDSLNHIMTADELGAVFRNVFRVLQPGGWLLFDLNLEHKYETWKGSRAIVKDDIVCVMEADADIPRKDASFRVVVFELDGGTWVRQDADLKQTWYPVQQVCDLLRAAGFVDVHCLDKNGNYIAAEELDKAYKAYFLCDRPGN
jgi:SAM-dependent methyltransferase